MNTPIVDNLCAVYRFTSDRYATPRIKRTINADGSVTYTLNKRSITVTKKVKE